MRKPKARNPIARHLRESGKYRSQVVQPRKGTGSYKRCEIKIRRPDASRDGGFASGTSYCPSAPPANGFLVDLRAF